PDRRVAGFLDSGQDLRVVDLVGGGDDELAGLCADLDVGDTGNLADLLADRHLAVPAGHARHLVFVRSHRIASAIWVPPAGTSVSATLYRFREFMQGGPDCPVNGPAASTGYSSGVVVGCVVVVRHTPRMA